MLSARTVKKMHSAGSNTTCGARCNAVRPMAIMLPHVGVSVSTLAPRMASVPSATIATAMPSSAIDNIAGNTLGSTSRQMMRRCFAPCARAARTNSRSDHDSVLARVMRPSTGIDTNPSARINATSGSSPPPFVPGCVRRMVTSASARITAGMARNTSSRRLTTTSTLPRK